VIGLSVGNGVGIGGPIPANRGEGMYYYVSERVTVVV
jgi:hypothetical protein